ncbi:MAG TPA: SAM-dependent methyltransferase [Hyphomonadaceae bacterium]|nr:SAM-dependent methyltransferase [Hyphomonadaceae bacterium]
MKSNEPNRVAPKRKSLALNAMVGAAQRILRGRLILHLPDGRVFDCVGAEPGGEAQLFVRDARLADRVFASGDVGFAESYLLGEWDTPDLPGLLAVCSDNFDALGRAARGWGLKSLLNLLGHLRRENTRKGSKENILAHYDLGNAFFAQWLDPSMTYSSALFSTADESLEAGQANKYRALANQLDLKPGQHVLEIGCGWGGFAEYAAKERGARVTAITISDEQHAFARARIQKAGLNDQVSIEMRDYRDLRGKFDHVASIEMFEAVGERYWPTYFSKITECLRDSGRAALQIITIRDDLFEGYRARVDFIQKYVFPGGMLPSISRLQQVTAHNGLKIAQLEQFGRSYAETLAQWRHRFESAWRTIAPLGFDERFNRLWRFYLAYCEAGFRTGRIDVAQLALVRA